MSYAYKANIYCDECGDDIIEKLDNEGVKDDGTTDNYPQPIFTDEADYPEHCAECNEFLENELTDEGYQYVIDAINCYISSGVGSPKILKDWAEFYGVTVEELIEGKVV